MEDLLRSVLKSSLSRNAIKILQDNITCVDLGLKPSFLWDIPARVDRSLIHSAIDLLKQRKTISRSIKVLILADDLFIFNAVEIELLFSNLLEVKFVNCSPTLESPEIFENRKDIFDLIGTMMNNIRENKSNDVLTIEGSPDWCFPTLFGFLLGYPVVYWSSSSDNNLSNHNLVLCKISFSNQDLGLNLENIFSFTFPSNLPLLLYVECWRKKLNERFSGDLSMTVTTVSYPLIVL